MRVLLAILTVLACSVPALAQPDRTAPVVYEFEAESVPGSRELPRGEIILTRQGRDRHTLIRPRGQFVEQLRASIEAL